MNHGILLLFAIPALCIVVIAIIHFGDEMFKKKFIIERRRQAAAGSTNSSHNRRYNDPKLPGHQSEATPEPSAAATDTRSLEASGIGN
jgi:hypothetical protein